MNEKEITHKKINKWVTDVVGIKLGSEFLSHSRFLSFSLSLSLSLPLSLSLVCFHRLRCINVVQFHAKSREITSKQTNPMCVSKSLHKSNLQSQGFRSYWCGLFFFFGGNNYWLSHHFFALCLCAASVISLCLWLKGLLSVHSARTGKARRSLPGSSSCSFLLRIVFSFFPVLHATSSRCKSTLLILFRFVSFFSFVSFISFVSFFFFFCKVSHRHRIYVRCISACFGRRLLKDHGLLLHLYYRRDDLHLVKKWGKVKLET